MLSWGTPLPRKEDEEEEVDKEEEGRTRGRGRRFNCDAATQRPPTPHPNST